MAVDLWDAAAGLGFGLGLGVEEGGGGGGSVWVELVDDGNVGFGGLGVTDAAGFGVGGGSTGPGRGVIGAAGCVGDASAFESTDSLDWM